MRLHIFEQFFNDNYNFTLDDLLINHIFQVDIYDILSKFKSFMVSRKTYTTNQTIKQYIVTVRNFLEYYDIEVSQRKFRQKVKIPKSVRRRKEPLTRDLIIKILENCSNYRLRIFLLCLAATGMRAGELCSIRLENIDFKNNIINIRGENTKTKEDRYIFMTDELRQHLLSYLDHKYRTRTQYTYYNKNTKQLLRLDRPVVFTPKRKNTDLVFYSTFDENGEKGKQKSFESIYVRMAALFDKLLTRLNFPLESSGKRHKITLHSFRRWVKGVISDQGYTDFSEWVLGHSGSPYYTRSLEEQYKLFKQLESSLTYLDQTGLESRHKDTESRLESVEKENRELKDNINKIMEMIQQNPKLAQVKPEALTKKITQ
jgi:integrase